MKKAELERLKLQIEFINTLSNLGENEYLAKKTVDGYIRNLVFEVGCNLNAFGK